MMIVNANALHIPLADESVQCVITSPPYWGLRDYGVDGQLGLESTPEEYISNMVQVFREIWRVLRPDGTLWLNLGDSYAGSGGAGGDYNPGGLRKGQPRYPGTAKLVRSKRVPRGKGSGRWGGGDRKVLNLPAKNLIGIPWRVAFALQADGWYLRQDIIWHKPNPMPESVHDRCTRAHEYIFLFAKSSRYYYNADAIVEPAVGGHSATAASFRRGSGKRSIPVLPGKAATHRLSRPDVRYNGPTRNRRSVWTVATRPYRGAHFATFPPELIEPMVLAGSRPGDIVLDPFAGTGTVGQVCIKYGRRFIGIELNPDYIKLAQRRTSNVQIALLAIGYNARRSKEP
ncbi:MAG TPA: site-specific DNA-methyltransferase [Chloroflexi bacterium]|nr:site-specific DNA-methyltransferase [Chloroflexota bacterium]